MSVSGAFLRHPIDIKFSLPTVYRPSTVLTILDITDFETSFGITDILPAQS
jgi:hypothetical protein